MFNNRTDLLLLINPMYFSFATIYCISFIGFKWQRKAQFIEMCFSSTAISKTCVAKVNKIHAIFPSKNLCNILKNIPLQLIN